MTTPSLLEESEKDAPRSDKQSPLLITVSFNAHRFEESPYFTSREAWAAACGARHVYVSESTTGLKLDAHCSAWLRLPMMQLLRGRALFYLDNDCTIAAETPTFQQVTGGLDGLFIARGHSTRPNSGVLLVSPNGSDIFDFCVDRCDLDPPEECAAPYENGHVIWACTQLPWRPLPQWLNNAADESGYIVHHTGPNHSLRKIDYHNDFVGQFDFSKTMVSTPAAMRQMAAIVLDRLGLAEAQ